MWDAGAGEMPRRGRINERMTTAETIRFGGRPRQMGQIEVEIIVSNALDRERQRRGEIGLAEVRSQRIQDVLVDTGAVLLCLPADVIARLGLPLEREVHVETAAGPLRAGLFSQLHLEISGRSGLFECLQTPAGTSALLGAVPMEVLGIEPEVSTRSIRLLPEGPGRSYMRAYGIG